jgi:acyl-CoA synthetase (NDP forming)
MLEQAIASVAADPVIDIVLVYVGLAPGPAARIAAEIVAGAHAAQGKPVLVCWLPENDASAHASLRQANLPIFTEPVRMVKAAAALAQHARAISGETPRALLPPEPLPGIAPAALGPGRVVGEHAAKQFLKTAGIETTRETLARSADDAVAQARSLGYPVCLKVVSPDIPHRTEIGAVRLDIGSDEQVRAAHDAILAASRNAVPGAKIEGILVQEMVRGGAELIVSAFRDPKLGPAVICGLGGILVEVLKDTAMRLAPVSVAEARAMLGELKGAAILSGVRGAPPLDVEAAAKTIQRLSEIIMADDTGIETIEINPLAVLPAGKGVRALDALITRVAGPSGGRP